MNTSRGKWAKSRKSLSPINVGNTVRTITPTPSDVRNAEKQYFSFIFDGRVKTRKTNKQQNAINGYF